MLARLGKQAFDVIAARCRRPVDAIRVDEGTKLVSRGLDLRFVPTCCHARLRPVQRKPTDNAFVESFDGKFGAECLNGIGS
jgi:putative transposase